MCVSHGDIADAAQQFAQADAASRHRLTQASGHFRQRCRGMTKRTRIASTSLVALLALCFHAWASPPSGVPPKDAEEAFASADVVFLGRVEKVLKDSYGHDSTAHVEVQRVWKGGKNLSRVVVVDGGGGPTYPARVFEVGETYLFYLPLIDNGKRLRADGFLNRVLPKDEASGDLVYLSQLHKS